VGDERETGKDNWKRTAKEWRPVAERSTHEIRDHLTFCMYQHAIKM
jgi:hypothetical protein